MADVTPKKQKTFNKEDRLKKIPKIVKYLFFKNGSTEKNLTILPGNKLLVSDVLALDQYHNGGFTEEDFIEFSKINEDKSIKVSNEGGQLEICVEESTCTSDSKDVPMEQSADEASARFDDSHHIEEGVKSHKVKEEDAEPSHSEKRKSSKKSKKKKRSHGDDQDDKHYPVGFGKPENKKSQHHQPDRSHLEQHHDYQGAASHSHHRHNSSERRQLQSDPNQRRQEDAREAGAPVDRLRDELLWLLNTGAQKLKIYQDEDGFVSIMEVIGKDKFRAYSSREIQDAVESDPRKRFELYFSQEHKDLWMRLSNRRARGRGGREDNPDVTLSKSLSFLLRHGAEKQGFQLMSGGFLYVDEILNRQQFRKFKMEDVDRVVKNNEKQRFFMRFDEESKRYQIRANQGHTIEVADLDLRPIKDATEYPTVVHGTYISSWKIIRSEGLKAMGRNHMHFALGEPGEEGVISGMRGSCQVLIFINLKRALEDNIPFFISANNVILSPGDDNGGLHPRYFKEVLQRKPRMRLDL